MTSDGALAEKLREVAKYHSERMAETRTVAHVIEGETTADRFDRFDLGCSFQDDGGKYLLPPEDLEIVGSVVTRGITVEEAADRLVQGWNDDPDAAETLRQKNADYIGVGATIVTGRAFVTIVFC